MKALSVCTSGLAIPLAQTLLLSPGVVTRSPQSYRSLVRRAAERRDFNDGGNEEWREIDDATRGYDWLGQTSRPTSKSSRQGDAEYSVGECALVTKDNGVQLSGVYRGDLLGGTADGEGEVLWTNAQGREVGWYQGSFQSGTMHGRGAFTWADGSVYEGEWQNDQMHGLGTKTRPDGTVEHAGRWAKHAPSRVPGSLAFERQRAAEGPSSQMRPGRSAAPPPQSAGFSPPAGTAPRGNPRNAMTRPPPPANLPMPASAGGMPGGMGRGGDVANLQRQLAAAEAARAAAEEEAARARAEAANARSGSGSGGNPFGRQKSQSIAGQDQSFPVRAPSPRPFRAAAANFFARPGSGTDWLKNDAPDVVAPPLFTSPSSSDAYNTRAAAPFPPPPSSPLSSIRTPPSSRPYGAGSYNNAMPYSDIGPRGSSGSRSGMMAANEESDATTEFRRYELPPKRQQGRQMRSNSGGSLFNRQSMNNGMGEETYPPSSSSNRYGAMRQPSGDDVRYGARPSQSPMMSNNALRQSPRSRAPPPPLPRAASSMPARGGAMPRGGASNSNRRSCGECVLALVMDRQQGTLNGAYRGDLLGTTADGEGEVVWTNAQGREVGFYTGFFKSGEMHGRGAFAWADGSVYEGEWQNDQMHGQGTKMSADGRVEHSGQWQRNQPVNGGGRGGPASPLQGGGGALPAGGRPAPWTTRAEQQVRGGGIGMPGSRQPQRDDGRGGFPSSRGVESSSSRGGRISAPDRFGRSTMRGGPGDSASASPPPPSSSGLGETTLYAKDGRTELVGAYMGELSPASGEAQGQGEVLWTDRLQGNDIGFYAGNFERGRMHGRGAFTWADGSVYEGEWQNDQMHGQGTKTNADGKVVHKGRWKNDVPSYW